MPPNVSDTEIQRRLLAGNVPESRWVQPIKMPKLGIMTTVEDWLLARAAVEGAEGLWRVDDRLYDLTTFIDQHPGGADWLRCTKGTDVTELFYSHHISDVAEQVLAKFYVRPAVSPRNSPFTFHRDGFYMGLRKKVRRVLAGIPEQDLQEARTRSRRINDALAVSALLTCGLAGACNSFLLGAVGGLLLSLTATCAHNFFHQRHNWRRYYFDLSLMSSREWMISHAMSHHMYPNSELDLEVTFFDPVMKFLPDPKKSLMLRYLSWVYSTVVYAAQIHAQLLKRIPNLRPSDGIALAVPAVMLLFRSSLVVTWIMWTWVLLVASFHFAYQGLTAGHHHPINFHEGDAGREENDFGLMQMDTTAYCTGVRGRESLIMCLTHFGNHQLHHLFPTIDHAILPFLEEIFTLHLQEHGVPEKAISSWEAVRGKYLQLANNHPNVVPPGCKLK